MIKQISVYTENKKGASRKILGVLSKENINVLGFVNNDSGEFGTARLIVEDDKTGEAYELLSHEGYLCRMSGVIGVELEDSPGALEKLFTAIDNMNINMDYVYIGYRRENSMPLILVHCGSMDIVEEVLIGQGFKVY